MISYHTRSGVLLTHICGEYLLVADRDARQTCPYVRHINETAALLWKMLERSASADELISELCSEYQIDEPQAEAAVKGYLEQLKQHGYLLTEENA